MNLKSKRELEVTKKKLDGLEQLHQTILAQPGERSYAQALTLRSLKRTINQLKEEIARFESKTPTSPSGN